MHERHWENIGRVSGWAVCEWVGGWVDRDGQGEDGTRATPWSCWGGVPLSRQRPLKARVCHRQPAMCSAWGTTSTSRRRTTRSSATTAAGRGTSSASPTWPRLRSSRKVPLPCSPRSFHDSGGGRVRGPPLCPVLEEVGFIASICPK